MSKLKPDYEMLQSIYDISDEFYELFLGPTMGYTLRLFRARRYDARRGAERQVRSGAGQAEARAGHDAARRRLRLGRRHAAGDRELRHQRHRPHAEQDPAGGRRGQAGQDPDDSETSRCGCRAGRSSRTRSTGSSRSARSSTSATRSTTPSSTWPTTRCPTTASLLLHTICGYHPARDVPARHEADVRVGPVHQVRHDRDLPRRAAAVGHDDRGDSCPSTGST